MGFAGSINYSNSKVDGDYASVIEQSGIKAGDNGYQITVAGNTDLKGGVIASSQAAIDQNKNSLTTGTLTISDIENRANYSASSVSVGGGLSMGSGGSKGNESGPHLQSFGNSKSAGGGFGSDSGSASSITQSGISGGTLVITDDKKQQELTGKTADQTVANVNRDITSDSASGGIAKNWDAQALKDEVQTQAQIMQTFEARAAKEIGSYADGKQKEALANAKAAYDAGDKDAAAAYAADADKWSEGGIYRIALHTVAGALSGGAEGALGAAASASAADLLNGVQSDLQQKLTDMGVSKDTAALIAQGATGAVATGLGAAIGGTAGAATALNTDFNNRQLSSPEKELAKKLAAKSGGKYTTAQIEAQMRGMTMTTNGVTSPGGSAVVAGAVAPKDNGGTWIYAGTTADGKPIIVQQLAPEDAEIRAFIVRNTTGSEVPSLITYAGPYTVSQSNTSSTALPPAPAGTQRATVMVDGVAYSPLVAPCPAAGCMNGDPIAYGISDPGTQAYVDAVNRKAEKDLNIGTAVLGIGGAIIRGISTVGEVAAGSSAAVGNSASAVGSAASKSTVGALDSGANSAGGMGKVIGNYSAIALLPL